MDNGLQDFAAKLEMLLPRLMRSLFTPHAEDPLMELPVAQLRVMRALFAANSTVSELSTMFCLSMSACTQMVNRLESMGLVTRHGDEGDRRVRHIGLSEEGRRQMNERHHARVERAKKALGGLSETERAQVITFLEKLLTMAEARSGPGESLITTAELEQALPMMRPYKGEESVA